MADGSRQTSGGVRRRTARIERSEIAKGRSLCPKGSAGGRWQLADLLNLPAAHRLTGRLVPGVWGEAVRQRPAAHTGAVEFELVAAMHLRGRKTIGGRRPRPQELAEQSTHLVRPGRMMIAAGSTRLPGALPSLGASVQEIGVEDVEAAATHLEFASGLRRGKQTLAKPRHDIANEWRRVTPAQLLVVFFKLRNIPLPPGASAYFAPPPLRSGSAK